VPDHLQRLIRGRVCVRIDVRVGEGSVFIQLLPRRGRVVAVPPGALKRVIGGRAGRGCLVPGIDGMAEFAISELVHDLRRDRRVRGVKLVSAPSAPPSERRRDGWRHFQLQQLEPLDVLPHSLFVIHQATFPGLPPRTSPNGTMSKTCPWVALVMRLTLTAKERHSRTFGKRLS
jgi:hypothetical protein